MAVAELQASATSCYNYTNRLTATAKHLTAAVNSAVKPLLTVTFFDQNCSHSKKNEIQKVFWQPRMRIFN